MNENCYGCDDTVLEYGDPFCKGCYDEANRKRKEAEEKLENLKTQVSELATKIQDSDSAYYSENKVATVILIRDILSRF